jgi:phosphoglycolate phosphatase
LDVLQEQGKKLFILTSRTHQEVEHMLKPDHDLAKRITTFYYRDVMEFHKPDPRAFDVLLNDHGFDRGECVYVGDSPSDAVAAKQAHMHFICSLESGVRTEDDFEGLGTDVFISRFTDLPGAVALLDKKVSGLA